jgi:hypothetical protein
MNRPWLEHAAQDLNISLNSPFIFPWAFKPEATYSKRLQLFSSAWQTLLPLALAGFQFPGFVYIPFAFSVIHWGEGGVVLLHPG